MAIHWHKCYITLEKSYMIHTLSVILSANRCRDVIASPLILINGIKIHRTFLFYEKLFDNFCCDNINYFNHQ